jgi:hypothetical protein
MLAIGEGHINSFGSPAEGWEAISERISTFISNNPDQKVTNNSLRVRLAMLYLANDQISLAKAAFSEIQGGTKQEFPRTRDRTLFQIHDVLIFAATYYDAEGGLPADRKTNAISHHTTLIEKVDELTDAADSDTREYIAEMLAYLSIKIFQSYRYNQIEENNTFVLLDSGFNQYNKLFDQSTGREKQLARLLLEKSDATLDEAITNLAGIVFSGDSDEPELDDAIKLLGLEETVKSLSASRKIVRAPTVLNLLKKTEEDQFSDLGLASILDKYFPLPN